MSGRCSRPEITDDESSRRRKLLRRSGNTIFRCFPADEAMSKISQEDSFEMGSFPEIELTARWITGQGGMIYYLIFAHIPH